MPCHSIAGEATGPSRSLAYSAEATSNGARARGERVRAGVSPKACSGGLLAGSRTRNQEAFPRRERLLGGGRLSAASATRGFYSGRDKWVVCKW